jgi:ABC-type nickel/cobalt efflux system permease component RcnA
MNRDEILQIQHSDTWVKGLLAACLNAFGLVVSNLEAIEAWLRIASLLVGIGVGIVTIWSITRRRR